MNDPALFTFAYPIDSENASYIDEIIRTARNYLRGISLQLAAEAMNFSVSHMGDGFLIVTAFAGCQNAEAFDTDAIWAALVDIERGTVANIIDEEQDNIRKLKGD